MSALLVELDDGRTLPLSACEWVFYAACGCPTGGCWAAWDDTVLATEGDAFREMYGTKREIEQARKDGKSARLVSREEFRDVVVPAMGVKCPHLGGLAGLRALTIRQPWATWIALGVKPTENRTWSTAHRGPLAIHAGAAFEEDAWRTTVVRSLPPGTLPGLTSIPKSAIIAVAELTDCHPYEPGCCPSVWAERGPNVWHWTLANVRALPEPVSCKGSLSLWRVPADVAALVAAQLEAVTA